MSNATGSYSISYLSDIQTAQPPKRAADRSQRTPLMVTDLRLQAFTSPDPHILPKSSSCSLLWEEIQVVQAPGLFDQAGKKGNLGQKHHEFEKLFLKWSNPAEESSAVYRVLAYAWLSQEIQESGQLRSVPINLPSLHFFTATLLL